MHSRTVKEFGPAVFDLSGLVDTSSRLTTREIRPRKAPRGPVVISLHEWLVPGNKEESLFRGRVIRPAVCVPLRASRESELRRSRVRRGKMQQPASLSTRFSQCAASRPVYAEYLSLTSHWRGTLRQAPVRRGHSGASPGPHATETLPSQGEATRFSNNGVSSPRPILSSISSRKES